jgi:hypothetical protein
VIGYLENVLLLVEPATGKVVHKQSLSTGYDEHSAWPIYREPHLLLASPFHVPAQLLHLEPGANDTVSVKTQWTRREFCNDILSSVLYKEHVYGFDLKQLQASPHRTSRGVFRCLEWATGTVCWSSEDVGHASVLAADGKLILFNDTGTLILARADSNSYHELGRVTLFEDAICWTPPLLWKGRLFVRGGGRAVCVFVGRPESVPPTTTLTHTRTEPGWSLDRTWLIYRERDFPNDAPSWQELKVWFACSGLIFGAVALLVVAVKGIAAFFKIRFSGDLLFWGLLFVAGFLAPRFFGPWFNGCVFTWPVSLYAALHLTLRACFGAEQAPARGKGRWLARAAMLGLVLVGYGYFELCWTIGMFIAWSFLFGLLPAFPLAMLAARAEAHGRPLWTIAWWSLLGFAALFWGGPALLLWRAGGS